MKEKKHLAQKMNEKRRGSHGYEGGKKEGKLMRDTEFRVRRRRGGDDGEINFRGG